MIASFSITCPKCNLEFPLTETLARPFIEAERGKMQQEAQDRAAAFQKNEQELVQDRRELAKLKQQLDAREREINKAVEEKVRTERESAFPGDQIEPVQNGRCGGDVVQKVVGPNGLACGTILWESKRTKNWSNDWLGKNREDQRSVGAHMGAIVSAAMPKGIDTFDRIEGVWVCYEREGCSVVDPDCPD